MPAQTASALAPTGRARTRTHKPAILCSTRPATHSDSRFRSAVRGETRDRWAGRTDAGPLRYAISRTPSRYST
ncbi:hypothetical protein BDW22DRAFT_1351738 [Trametopsis cervina]|nr:hypothetical protein BDW22DRAFT_1351738 [Trametopsis cervina]